MASDVQIRTPYNGIIDNVAVLFCKIIRKTLKILNINPKKIFIKHQKISSKYRNKDYKTYTTFECSDMKENACCHNEIFLPIKVNYEDVLTNVYNNYDINLKRLYGNYMEMPPKHLRYNHRAEIIDFG